MLRRSLKSIAVLFRYAHVLTVVKVLQILLSAVLAPLSIYFTQRIIDALGGVLSRGDAWQGLLPWVAALLVAMFLSSVGGSFLNGILYVSIKRRLAVGMTPDILDKFRRLDYGCFEDRDLHDTLQRMTDDPQDKVFQLFLTILGVIECAIGVVGGALIFAQAGWWFVVGFSGLLVPMIWLDFKAADQVNTMMNNQSMDERRLHDLGGLLSGKASLFELKLFRATGYIAAKWRGLAKTVLDTRVRTTVDAQKYFLLSTILFKCWSFFILLSLVSGIVHGSIGLGLFTALVTSTGAVLGNAELMSHVLQNMRARYLLMEHYVKFLSLPEYPVGEAQLPEGPVRIEFQNVTFTYPKTTQPVLRGVSFVIEPGQRVALVGKNGAGKSTIVKLLCRLYAPASGRILVNGQDIGTLQEAALRRVFSVVFQDYCRYALTLRENVALGDLEKLQDDEALQAALRMGLAQGIAELDAPLGKLEQEGVDLSGGQWQRLALARACLPRSAFVILDEPTAAMDPVAESAMYTGFAEVLRNRGCLMISHRLASARLADRIIVLADGAVAESGSHGEMMGRGGLYAAMYAAQSAWYTEGAAGELDEEQEVPA